MKQLILLIATTSFLTATALAQAPFNLHDNIGAGNCLEFDGIDDYVTVPFDASLHPNDITLSLWIKISSTPSTRTWFISNSGAGANPPLDPYRIALETNRKIRVQFEGDNGTTFVPITSGSALNVNEWYHIAASYNSTTNDALIYVNGVLEANSNVNMNMDNNNLGLTIGATQDENGNAKAPYFHGVIDEINIWNIALTQNQIKNNMCRQLTGSETGLVGYWNMNEGSDNTCAGGEDVCDQSGNGNHGTKF